MKLRLLKVVVQPVFVLDDGENLTERTVEPVTIPASDWPDFFNGFDAQVRQLAQEVAR